MIFLSRLFSQPIGNPEIRKVKVQPKKTEPLGICIEFRGRIPVKQNVLSGGFVTSLIDYTDETSPVLSEIEQFQEKHSPAYQVIQRVGALSPGCGIHDWARVGVVFPDVLRTAYGGKRKLQIILRLVNLGDMPNIRLGMCSLTSPGLILQQTITFDFDYPEKGYMDAVVHRDEARGLAIRLAVAVAIVDGRLDEKEGQTIKGWIIKTIAPFDTGHREHLKSLYNDALRSAYADARSGNLSLSQVTIRLNKIAEKSQKYEAIELCLDVMAADGIADEKELNTIRKIGEALGLDYTEIDKMRDKRLLDFDIDIRNPDAMLGISPSWDREKIRTHIRREYAKWNGRLNSLEGAEREKAQEMLDLLAQARKRYDD